MGERALFANKAGREQIKKDVDDCTAAVNEALDFFLNKYKYAEFIDFEKYAEFLGNPKPPKNCEEQKPYLGKPITLIVDSYELFPWYIFTPLQVIENNGITYDKVYAGNKGEPWIFCNCGNVPYPLPRQVSEFSMTLKVNGKDYKFGADTDQDLIRKILHKS